MSDYLWDKSGEPDPAIERLEEVLAARRYEPEPLRLPPAIPVHATPVVRPRPVYPYIAAALAAGVVLAIIVGVWSNEWRESVRMENLYIAANNARTETPKESQGSSASGANAREVEVKRRPENEAVGSEERWRRSRSIEPRRAVERDAGVTERAADEPLKVVRLARRSRSISPDNMALSVALGSAGGMKAETRNLVEQRHAKEQLMLALRLTSAKLNVARDKTQAAHAAEGESR